jgi:hypothetical protein
VLDCDVWCDAVKDEVIYVYTDEMMEDGYQRDVDGWV